MEETTPGDETSEPEVVFVGQPATVNVNSAPQVSGGTQTPTNAVASLVLAILGIMTVIGGASIYAFLWSLFYNSSNVLSKF